MDIIKCNSDSSDLITKVFLENLKSGYSVHKAYQKRKYWIFGKVYYYIEMRRI